MPPCEPEAELAVLYEVRAAALAALPRRIPSGGTAHAILHGRTRVDRLRYVLSPDGSAVSANAYRKGALYIGLAGTVTTALVQLVDALIDDVAKEVEMRRVVEGRGARPTEVVWRAPP